MPISLPKSHHQFLVSRRCCCLESRMSNLEEECEAPSLLFHGNDSAWYQVFLSVDSTNRLYLVYEDYDNKEGVIVVNNKETLDHLCKNLQSLPEQLYDQDCQTLEPSQLLLVSVEDDRLQGIKYYEAALTQIFRKKHSIVDERELCMCTFGIKWLSGPDVGRSTLKHSESVYLPQPGSVQSHPVLLQVAKFIESGPEINEKAIANIEHKPDHPYDVKQPLQRIKADCSVQEKALGCLQLESQFLSASVKTEAAVAKAEDPQGLNSDLKMNSFMEFPFGITGHQFWMHKDSSSSIPFENIGMDDKIENASLHLQSNSLSDAMPPIASVVENGHEVFIIEDDEEKNDDVISKDMKYTVKELNQPLSRIGDNTDGFNLFPCGVHLKCHYYNDLLPLKKERDISISKSDKLSEKTKKSPNFEVTLECIKTENPQKQQYCPNSKVNQGITAVSSAYAAESGGDDMEVAELRLDSLAIHQSAKTNQDLSSVDMKNVSDSEEAMLLESEDGMFSLSNVILIENLEKDATRSDVLAGICQVTTCPVKVYIIPVYEHETFTRGYVCFKEKKSFYETLRLLQNEDFFIVSSNCRPWIASEAKDHLSEDIYESFRIVVDDLQEIHEDYSTGKIIIISRDSQEYAKVKKLRELFIDFTSSLRNLHTQMGKAESEELWSNA